MDKNKEKKQKTPQGHEIPVPKRGEFIANLEKAARKPQKESEDKDSTTDDSEKE